MPEQEDAETAQILEMRELYELAQNIFLDWTFEEDKKLIEDEHFARWLNLYLKFDKNKAYGLHDGNK